MNPLKLLTFTAVETDDLKWPTQSLTKLAQIRTTEGERRIEECDFVEKGARYSKRFCEQIRGLCRHMPTLWAVKTPWIKTDWR